jgi:hypothetical protein
MQAIASVTVIVGSVIAFLMVAFGPGGLGMFATFIGY